MSKSILIRINHFFRHPAQERLLFFKAVILLGLIVIALRVLPFQVILAKVSAVRASKFIKNGKKTVSEEKISWAVFKAGQFVPYAKCLAKALAVKILYARYGYPAEIKIGVEKINNNQIKAHAWVESSSKVVTGNVGDIDRYQELPSLEKKKT